MITEMKLDEALTLFFSRSDAMQQYWAIYAALVVGIFAFWGTVQTRSKLTAVLLTVGFACFAFVNCGGIIDVATQRVEICKYLSQGLCNGTVTIEHPLKITLNPPPVLWVKVFHIVSDIIVVCMIWVMVRLSDKNASVEKHRSSHRG